MDKIIEKISNNNLLGFIKYKEVFNFYLMPVACWILNYSKYDPSYNPNEWEFVFRDNVLNVEDTEVERFLQSVEEDKLSIDDADKVVRLEREEEENVQVCFFIDFDAKLYVNGFSEIEVEEYLPNKNWVGKYESPLTYLPEKIRLKLGV